MFRIKRIDRYIFSQFIGLFSATFFICILVLLMQFVWQHVNDLVGKGFDFIVFVQFFWYATLTLVPLALPLSILLTSLMTFGGLGEKMELSAMKAAGISLFRIMRSLLIFIIFICIGAFVFSNNVLPKTQTKLWTLVLSMRQTSPELEIPTNEFYSGIRGYNFYVKEKDHKRKLLKNLMIYDFSAGFNNASVILADSARIQMSEDKYFLLLTVYNGESFENLEKKESYDRSVDVIPYRRETFERKELLIDFNANFAKQNEDLFKNEHISKNIAQLSRAIDSTSHTVDSILYEFKQRVLTSKYAGLRTVSDTTLQIKSYSVDSLFVKLPKNDRQLAVERSIMGAEEMMNEIGYNKNYVDSERYYIRRYGIEWHRKFTLSFACLIFFFIGAPLGAIIRKGGLGLSVVISVIMFIVYFIIDNSGFKMAREGILEVWKSLWLSSAVLLPLGIFLTYKAATDSAIFNPDTYIKIINKIGSFFVVKKTK